MPVYGQMGPHPDVLLLLSPLLGYVGHGYFSVFWALLAELFPTAARATGQGLTYNCGRTMGALGPFTIGYLATLGSHRVSSDAPLVRHGAERAVVRAAVVSGGRELRVELEITPGRANRARLNGAPRPRAGST